MYLTTENIFLTIQFSQDKLFEVVRAKRPQFSYGKANCAVLQQYKKTGYLKSLSSQLNKR